MKVFPFIVNGEARFGGQEQSMDHAETIWRPTRVKACGI